MTGRQRNAWRYATLLMRAILVASLGISALALFPARASASNTVSFSTTLTSSDPTIVPNGGSQSVHYRSFQFNLPQSGTYTINATPSGWSSKLYLYQGGFLPNSPNVNYWGSGTTSLSTGPAPAGYFVLVVAGASPSDAGPVDISISGPAAVQMNAVGSANTNAPQYWNGTGATLSGRVQGNGVAATVSFQWGTTAGGPYPNTVNATPGSIDGSNISTSITAQLSGLTPNTTYYYRIVATNSLGTVPGNQVSFTTNPPGQITLGTGGLSGPYGLSVDASGTVFVADSGNNRVVKITADGTQSAILSTGSSTPSDVATDSHGTIYVPNYDYNSNSGDVVTLDTHGVQGTVGSGFAYPSNVAVDSSDNLYVSDFNDNRVVKITPQGATSTIGSAFSSPAGVAVDAQGTVYIADSGNARVVKVTPGGTQTTLSVTGLSVPYGVAVDGNGTVYIADASLDHIVTLTAGGTQGTIGTGLSGPSDVAVDSDGNVYVADTNNNRVVEIVNPSQPASTATDTPTDTATATPTNTPTDTPTSTDTPSNTPTATATASSTDTPTDTATDTPTSTDTPTATPTDIATDTPTSTSTDTATPSETATATHTPTATATSTPTSTATNTATPTGTATPTTPPIDTATATSTLVPPMATNTSTATSVPSTATATRTAAPPSATATTQPPTVTATTEPATNPPGPVVQPTRPATGGPVVHLNESITLGHATKWTTPFSIGVQPVQVGVHTVPHGYVTLHMVVMLPQGTMGPGPRSGRQALPVRPRSRVVYTLAVAGVADKNGRFTVTLVNHYIPNRPTPARLQVAVRVQQRLLIQSVPLLMHR